MILQRLRDADGPALLELCVRPGNRDGIGRPTRTPAEAKRAFMAAAGAPNGDDAWRRPRHGREG